MQIVHGASDDTALNWLERRAPCPIGQRAYLFPVTLDAGVVGAEQYGQGRSFRLIPVTNGGPGVALNVRGSFTLASSRGGVTTSFLQTSIAPNQTLDLILDWGPAIGSNTFDANPFAGATGDLLYEDSFGTTWNTKFSVLEANGRLSFRVDAPRVDPTSRHQPGRG